MTDTPTGTSTLSRGLVEELSFVNPHNRGRRLQLLQDRARIRHRPGGKLGPGVGGDFFEGVAVVDGGLEDLNLLASNGGAPQAANQFVGLAAKH